MSDEQKMPDDLVKVNTVGWDADAMQEHVFDCHQAIRTLTAERDALQAKVDTIINYINSEETNEATGFWLKMLLGYEQAAQLKEQDDE